MFIHTKDQALDAVAAILDLPERRLQLVQSTVQIMLCLEAEARRFMADAQALLIEGGLESLRRRRHEAPAEPMPLVVIDPEEDRMLEAVASAIDALRLSDVVLEVFPGLAPRWRMARALLSKETMLQEAVVAAVRGRGNEAKLTTCRLAAESVVRSTAPAWEPRAGDLRSACDRALLGAALLADSRFAEEAEALFAVLASSDAWAEGLLEALDRDPAGAAAQAARLYDLLNVVRAGEWDAALGPDGYQRAA